MKKRSENTKKRSEPKLRMEPEPQSLFNIGRERRQDNVLFEEEECDLEFRDYAFYECIFRNVTFLGKVSRCMFTDVIFDHCDLSNCDFRESVMRRVKIDHCRMTGTDLSRSTLEDLTIAGSNCSYINFNGSKMKRFLLAEDRCNEAGFSMCTFENPEVMHCDFSGSDFFATKLKDFDFTTSTIDGIAIDPADLKGVVVNEEQAVAFARILGIIVR